MLKCEFISETSMATGVSVCQA